jgi:5-methylcytosine-specific restriction endonuclease McrA
MGYVKKDKQRSYQLVWIKTRRLDWIASNGPCVSCGSSDNLEVDHIDPALKTMNPRNIWSRTQEARDKELANCQVLCSPCHKKKTSLERLKEHGTMGRYSNGCRCDECKVARKLKAREERGRVASDFYGDTSSIST